MTVRLSAMFEEHMGKIIYNWKVAKRRENVQNGRRRRSIRKQNVQNGNDNTSDSDEASSNNNSGDEKEVLNERVNGFTRNTQIHQQNNNKAKYLPSSSSEEGPSTSFANNKIAKHKSDSEDSYKPNSRKRKKKVEESSSTEITESEDDDDSDNQPLSMHKYNLTRLRPKRSRNFSSSDSSSSFMEIYKMRTRQRKLLRYIEDSDSDGDCKLVKQKNCENSDDSNGGIVTVSSRGRVRRLTARARALLKK